LTNDVIELRKYPYFYLLVPFLVVVGLPSNPFFQELEIGFPIPGFQAGIKVYFKPTL